MTRNQHILFPLLKFLDVPFTIRYLRELTEGMPSSETLLGISNILKGKYHVECICLRIEKDDIFKLDTPFIVQINDQKNALVTDIESNRFSLLYKNKKFIYSKGDLFASWTGVVLLAAPKKDSGEQNYWYNFGIEMLGKIRLPVIGVLTAALAAYFGAENLLNLFDEGTAVALLLLSYCCGTTLSALLLFQTVDKSDSLVTKVCGSGKKNGCSKILDGGASKIFGITWSEIGFIYFLGSLLAFILVKQSVGILFIVSILTLPYTFWSIYYQWRVAKQWCPFCVSIQATLWTIFFLYLASFGSVVIDIDMGQLVDFIACFAFPALFLWLVLPLARNSRKLAELTMQYKGLKFSEEIIASALALSTPIDTNGASAVIFGNQNTKLNITIVTSLYCRYCVEANEHVRELLRQYREKISVQVVFNIRKLYPLSEQERGAIRRVISIYQSFDQLTAEEAYYQLYDEEAGKDSSKSLPPLADTALVDSEIDKQAAWLSDVAISGTPTVFVNGYRLPRWYALADLEQWLFFEMVDGINYRLESKGKVDMANSF